MVNYIIEAVIELVCYALMFASFASFIFMFYSLFLGYIIAGFVLFIVSIMSMAVSNFLIENGWKLRR